MYALADRLGMRIERVAYEPLLLQNHSYYSKHWIGQRFAGQDMAARVVRWVLSRGMRVCFAGLMRLGQKYFWLLRGQALYVLMSKP